MAKVREEIVGKRFLSVSNCCNLKLNKISEWDWRAGVIRACTHTDCKHPDLQVLVEYEDVSWQRREWIHVHRDRAFQILLVEHTLVWAPRKTGNKLRTSAGTLWPALVFDSLVDEVGLSETKERPLEFLSDRHLEYHDYSLLREYQDGECLRTCDENSEISVREWVAEQDGQRILCTTPSVLVGFRVQVYRSEGTTQWYTAVIVGYNETTRELTVTDDTVLEEHSEDPSLVHIRLLGEGVVESILRGENVGITPRRSRSSANHHQTGVRQIRRDHGTSTRGRNKNSLTSKSLTSSTSPLEVLSPPSPTRPTSPTSPLLSPVTKSHLLASEQESAEENSLVHLSLTCSTPGDNADTLRLTKAAASPSSLESAKGAASHPASPTDTTILKIADENFKKKSLSPASQPPRVESPVQHIHITSSNLSNSPSSPTNPDKPTNPRQSDSQTSLKTAHSDNISEEPLSASGCLSSASASKILKLDSSKHQINNSWARQKSAATPVLPDIKELSVQVECLSVVKSIDISNGGRRESKPTAAVRNSVANGAESSLVENTVKSNFVKSPNFFLNKTSCNSGQESKGLFSDQKPTEKCKKSEEKSSVSGPSSADTSRCSKSEAESGSFSAEATSKASADSEHPKEDSDSNKTEPSAATEITEAVNSKPPSPKQQNGQPTKVAQEKAASTDKDSVSPGVSVSNVKLESSDSGSDEGEAERKQRSPNFEINEQTVKQTVKSDPERKSLCDSIKENLESDVRKVLSGEVTVLNNGRVRPIPIVLGSSSAPSTSVPDYIKVNNSDSNSHRPVILLPSDVTPYIREEKASTTTCSAAFPSIAWSTSESSLPQSVSAISSFLSSRISPLSQEGGLDLPPEVEVSAKILNSDCTLSLSRAGGRTPVAKLNDDVSILSVSGNLSGEQLLDPTSRGNVIPSATSGGGGLVQNLAAAGAVSGRAVTITATSGPAPQGTSRVASPPSVSITAVVRSPISLHSLTPQHQLQLETSPHLQDGVGSPLHPHPPLHPPFASSGSLAAILPSRMDTGDGSSDSGVSVTERSVSRSSVLSDDRSSSAEVKPNTPTPTPTLTSSAKATSLASLVVDRKENIKVWRNPAVLSQPELSVRHIHSLQNTAMSQHFPGVPPHIPPSGAQAVAHPSSHPSTHGPPPPSGSLSHALPPGLHYPGHHAPPLHLAPGLQPSLNAAAALYPHNQQDVWKQLGHVAPLTPHAYMSLLPRHQEELSYFEQHARELEKQQSDRIQRERLEAEAREKQAKEKMERERAERQRKERERSERAARRPEWVDGGSELQLVNQHFEDSFRYASQKHGRENLRETHPASLFYGQGLTNHQQSSPHLTHSQSLLISQQQKQQEQQQNKIYQPQPQKGSPAWSQHLSSLSLKVDPRDHRQQQQQQQLTSRQHPPSQLTESLRKVKDSDQFVPESIHKAFRAEDPGPVDPLMKPHTAPPPPPAHSKHLLEKAVANLQGYPPSHYGGKDHKTHPADRSSYSLHLEKPSVIVQPELKYDKIPQHSISPKQRPLEQANPFAGSASSSHYKPYDPSPTSRSATLQSVSLSPNPHTVELSKTRQPHSSPHTPPTSSHADRYYSSGTKPSINNPYQSALLSGGLLPNHLHSNALPSKAKVSSPPPQVYGKPGTQVCKVETRPCQQPLSLTSKASTTQNGPPPAHSGSRNHESRPPPAPHEQRVAHNRSPFDARLYAGSGTSHPKTVAPSTITTHSVSRVPTVTPHVSGHPVPAPTQTQPLNLGTKDGGTSPTSRRQSQTPTLQEMKKPRLDTVSVAPVLSRVSEPSPLYPVAATTITTIENTVALANLQRVSSPATVISHGNEGSPGGVSSSNPTVMSGSSPPAASGIVSDNGLGPTLSRPRSQPPPSSTPNSVRANSSSPVNMKQIEPEKANSPGAVACYVHKLKKAWLQRHESGTETFPCGTSVSTNVRISTPPPNSSSSSTSSSKPCTPVPSIKQESKGSVRKQKLGAGIPNGHGQDSKDLDSTTSDSEDSSSLKSKRGKTKRNVKRMKKSSESNSDSDKESDGSESSLKKPEPKQDSEPRRRRGRKPKSKPDKDDGAKFKKSRDDLPQSDPLQKPPISQLKKSGESFLQDRSCYEVAPKLPKCRECRWTPHQRNKKMPNNFCRFYAFRRLRYTKNGQLAVAGFSDPVKDAFGEDLRLWVPDPSAPAPDLDMEKSKFLLSHVGDQFCDLVQQEKAAMALHMGEDKTIAWKRVVQGVREMCDVCETTLFNIHWACSKCGFVVCIDCYEGRKEGTIKIWDTEEGAKERDKFSWLLCASRIPHEQDKLMLTQIIAGNALVELGKKVHEVRYKWGVPMYCGCPEAAKYKEKEQEEKKLNGINKDLMKSLKKDSKPELVNGSVKTEKNDRVSGKDEEMSNSPLNFLVDVALSSDKRESDTSNSDSDSDSDDKEGQPSTLRELLVRPNAKNNSQSGKEEGSSLTKSKEPLRKKAKLDTLDDVISCVIERNVDKDIKNDPKNVELKHFIRKYNYNRKGREPLPIRIMTKTESRQLYPDVLHSWLCDGKLLRLHDSLNKKSIVVFQDQWKRGQPVIVSGSGQNLTAELWKPASFSKDFGDVKNNLINCLTDNIVPNQPMKKFWDGFENFGKRLKDEKGQPMVLKLKDWPPSDDFAEMLPSRFQDLMKSLPMGEYTKRNGSLNLAGRLPECFVRPDLGPKMYIAYGAASYPGKASTNLHLDISDAANIMCYVGLSKDMEYEENIRDVLKAIDEAGCDILTRQRVREKEEIPGALWHIYHARDADKIRDLLNKVAIERGKKLEPFHDPIHDQSCYLDGPLRERLYKEYAVEGYAIVQCMGDAVFVPAGAPHQVRNLLNCVKVAEDFVSPENIAHCFHLTEEFRHLSDTHTNHEDKLQIKNIMYHAMKDSVATLLASEMDVDSSNFKKEEDDS